MKRDLRNVVYIRRHALRKETLKRDPHMRKEAYLYEKRPVKRRVHVRIVVMH